MTAMRVADRIDNRNWMISINGKTRLVDIDDIRSHFAPWREELSILNPGQKTKLERKYYEVVLQACSAGFGEYERHPNGPEDFWSDEGDLLAAMSEDNDQYELGVDTLPDGVGDITGLIHHEPPRVFWSQNGYCGIDYVDPSFGA